MIDIITDDRNTMIACAIERIQRGDTMSGLVVVRKTAPYARLIEDILILAECTDPSEWQDRIEYIPL